jgi:hypothetical protein
MEGCLFSVMGWVEGLMGREQGILPPPICRSQHLFQARLTYRTDIYAECARGSFSTVDNMLDFTLTVPCL